MTFEHFTIAVLLTFCLVREYMFWQQTQLLINKLMSKNFFDYETSRTMTEPTPEKPKIVLDDEAGPDVGDVMAGMI